MSSTVDFVISSLTDGINRQTFTSLGLGSLRREQVSLDAGHFWCEQSAANLSIAPTFSYESAVNIYRRVLGGNINVLSANVNAGTDTISSVALTTGNAVVFTAGTNGVLPGGITGGVVYYVYAPTGTTIQLYDTYEHAVAHSGAGLVNITSSGTNPMSLNYYVDTQIFSGVVTKIPAIGSGNREDRQFEFTDLWWYLDNIVFQQLWNYPVTPTDQNSALATQYLSAGILNMKIDGTSLIMALMLSEVNGFISVAFSGSPPLQIGTFGGLPSIAGPWTQTKDLTCAEVIRKILLPCPDSVSYWDYSTTPPTLKGARRSVAAAVSYNVDDGNLISELSYTARYDLQVPAVVIIYQYGQNTTNPTFTIASGSVNPGADTITITSHGLASGTAVSFANGTGAVPGGLTPGTTYFARAVDANTLSFYDTAAHAIIGGGGGLINITTTGTTGFVMTNLIAAFTSGWTQTNIDAYPPASTGYAPKSLVMTVTLMGGDSSVETQKLKTRYIDLTSTTWWKKHLVWLADVTITGISLANTSSKLTESGAGLGALINEVIEGSIPWWRESAGARATISATVSYTTTDSGGSEVDVINQPIAVEVIATSLQSPSETSAATFKWNTFSAPEPVPPNGLAQAIYDSFSTLQFDGSVKLTEAECSCAVYPSELLTLNGSLNSGPAAAQIQKVEEDFDAGETTITFGPAKHLSPDDIISSMRLNRERQESWMSNTRANAIARTPSQSTGSPKPIQSSPGGGAGPYKKIVITDGGAKQIVLDPTLLGAAEVATIQTISVCVAGVTKSMKVLGTTPV